MNIDFEDRYLDVLQNIEWGLFSTVKAPPELCDYDMLRVIEYTIAYYKFENKGRKMCLTFLKRAM
jgi:hypothetical protein